MIEAFHSKGVGQGDPLSMLMYVADATHELSHSQIPLPAWTQNGVHANDSSIGLISYVIWIPG